jgi:hypothetical protein
MDLKGSIPCFIRITGGSVHDVNVLDELLIEPGAFYIMDRGYIDFARLYTFAKSMAFFLTRAKTNLDYTRISYRTVDKTTGLRSDQTILLRGPRTSQEYPVPLRRIRYYDADTDKRLVFLTNNFTLDAITIAQLWHTSAVLQMAQTTPAHQGVFRHIRKRRQDTDLDCRQRLCPDRHHQKGTAAWPQFGRNPANHQHCSFRASTATTTTYGDPSAKRNLSKL